MEYPSALKLRSDRESFWLFKHFFYPLVGTEYYRPQDFWFGTDELWNFEKKVEYRFLKIWLCSSLNVYCLPFLVSLSVHVFICVEKPNYVHFYEILSPYKITGAFFLMCLVLSIGIGLIGAVEHFKSKSIQR